MRSFILVLVTLAAGPGPALAAQGDSDDSSIIVVTGQALESIPPDALTIQFVVSDLEERPEEAAERTEAAADAVADAIEAIDVPEIVLSRIGYGVGPHWEYNADREREFRGYAARMIIRVETSSLDVTGRIVEAALSSGADQIESIRYTSSRLAQTRRSALQSAVRAAHADAEAMAEAAGGTLGRLLLLTTEDLDPPPGVQLQALQAGVVETNAGRTRRGPQLTPEDISIRARVRSRWEFLPAPPSNAGSESATQRQ